MAIRVNPINAQVNFWPAKWLSHTRLVPPAKVRPAAFTAFLICAIFWTDLHIPLGVACGVPYVWAMLSTHWSKDHRVTIGIALLCSILTYLGTLLSPSGAPMWVVVANRLLAIFAIWLTTVLCIIRQQNESRLEKARAEIAENARLLHSILAGIREGVIVGGSNGQFVMTNTAAGEWLQKFNKFDGRMTPDLPESFVHALQRASTGEPTEDQEVAIGSGDKVRWLSLNATPLLHEQGGEDRGVLTIHDITHRKKLETAIVNAAETERCRIGRDLHDGLIQQLSGVSLMLQTVEAQMRAGCGDFAVVIRRASDHLDGALRAARQMAHGLFPVELEHHGLTIAIQHHLGQLERLYGIRAEYHQVLGDGCGFTRLPADDSVHLFRIVQEATANTCRHAGATRLRLTLECESGGRLRLVVEDDGRGLRSTGAAETGIGIRSMAYRARAMGGRIELSESSLGGLKVEVCRESQSNHPSENAPCDAPIPFPQEQSA